MEKLFWLCGLVTLATTGLLLLWSWPLSPFTYPGIRANEAAIIFFPVMFLRWFALSIMLLRLVAIGAQQFALARGWSIGAGVVIFFFHLVFGLFNLGIMNVWLSVDASKTRVEDTVYAAIYFGLPLLVLIICIAFKLVVPHPSR